MLFEENAYLIRKNTDPSSLDSTVPHIGLEHIAQERLRLTGIGKSTEVTSTKQSFQGGDILFGKLRPYFRKVVRPSFDGICSTDIWVIRPKGDIDPRFLFYWCSSWDFVNFVNAASEGTRMPRAKWGVAQVHQIPDFSINEQKTISHILGTLDDKIELNQKINQTLEEIAKAIFKSWFVDFDPVRAKAEGRPTGLPPEISDLFPDELVESEIGEIPEGWEVRNFDDIFNYLEGPGIRNWQYTNDETGVRFINIRCIRNGDLQLETANRITAEEAFGKYAHFALAEDDVVVSTSGTLGRYAFVRKSHLPLNLNTSVIRFRAIEGVSTLHFLTGFVQNQLQYELEIRASGSVQRNFGPMHLRQIELLVPPNSLLEQHQKIIDPFFRKRQLNLEEVEYLSRLRDTLLPKLISGELRIPDAEKFLEGAST